MQADATAEASPPASKSATRGRRSTGRKRTATRPGQRADDVLRVVTANPGIAVREIGEELGADATGLYRVANKLSRDGRRRREGTKLYAAESDGVAAADETGEPAAVTATATDGGATSAASDEDEDGTGSPEADVTGSA